MTKVKQKRKQAPNRFARPAIMLGIIILLVGIGSAAYWMLSPSHDSDIIFLRYNVDNAENIYTLDVDNPEAEPVALTDYGWEYTAENMLISDDKSFAVFIEREREGRASRIVRLDIASGEQTELYNCSNDDGASCWNLNITDDGKYIASSYVPFGTAPSHVLLLSTSNEMSPLVLGGSISFIQFIDNVTLEYVDYDFEIEAPRTWAYNIETEEKTEIEREIQPPSLGMSEGSFSVSGGGISFQGNIAMAGSVDFNSSGSVSNSNASVYEIIVPTDNPRYSIRMDATPNVVKAYLVDQETGEESQIFDQSQYIIREVAWNSDGTQLAFMTTLYNTQQLEGELWVYDLETSETTALNEVGHSVNWLR